jgi:hypothetical protein
MKTIKGRAARVLTLVFAVSLASAYVVRSQLQQNRSVASTSKSLSAVFSPSSEQTAPSTNLAFSSKTNAPPQSGTAAASTGSAGKVSSSIGTQTVTAASSRMMFPGSKSSAVFDLQPGTAGPAQKQTAGAITTNSRAMKH